MKSVKNSSAYKGDSFMEDFNINPDEKHWDIFQKRLKKDKARYYQIVYPTEVKERMNLKKAYAVIYDGKYRQLYKVPIVKSARNGIEGATIYFKDLEVNRKVMQ